MLQGRENTRIVRGLCCIMSAMASGGQAGPYLAQLAAVPAEKLNGLLAGELTPECKADVRAQLDLLAHMLKETDMPVGEGDVHPVVGMFEAVVPAVQYAMQACHTDESVVEVRAVHTLYPCATTV